jgi:hypothetical protein
MLYIWMIYGSILFWILDNNYYIILDNYFSFNNNNNNNKTMFKVPVVGLILLYQNFKQDLV